MALDEMLVSVEKFDGDLKTGHEKYQIATQKKELIEEEKSLLEESLKKATGFHDLNVPKEPALTRISRGDITFVIKSYEKSVQRPPYSKAVAAMEIFLNGIISHFDSGRKVSGMFREGKFTYIRADDLLEEFELYVYGILKGGIEHKISYETTDTFSKEKIEQISLKKGRNPSAITEENFANYVRMDRLLKQYNSFAKDYKKKLGKKAIEEKETVRVSEESAYAVTKTKSEGPDWAYVVKTLITVPTDPESEGELNILASPEISKAEKEKELPFYALLYKSFGEKKVLYVAVESILERIYDLKTQKKIEAKKIKAELKQVV